MTTSFRSIAKRYSSSGKGGKIGTFQDMSMPEPAATATFYLCHKYLPINEL
jgi:hypothetical protein